jgi:3-dehydroquinate synthase
MTTVRVGVDPPYDIHIGKGLLERLPELVRLEKRRVLAVTDRNVARYHLAALAAVLDKAGVPHSSAVLPAGEAGKDLAAVRKVYEAAHAANIGRGDLIVALGGGVVGDIAGFAAATWCRGIGCVQVPTTLLSMADSSVGGKTGVDFRDRKNGVGAFSQPEAVIMDPSLLDTLSPRHAANGMAEVIKHGFIADPALLDLLESPSPSMEEILVRSVRVKTEIVQRDPTEKGDRALLNFGHTFGHAIESHYRYKKWLHGEAVAIGMVLACPDPRLPRVLERWGLPVEDPRLDPAVLIGLIGKDKKLIRGTLRFIRVDEPGKSRIEEMAWAEVEAMVGRAAAAAQERRKAAATK